MQSGQQEARQAGDRHLLEREAGHVLVSLVLIVLGVILSALGVSQHGDSLVIFALGVLGRSMGVGSSNGKSGGK
jgi:hypothetical protein